MTGGVLLLSDRAMIEHDPGPGEPERPQRLAAILERLEAHDDGPGRWRRPAAAPREAIERIHRAGYVDHLESFRGRRATLGVDTFVGPESLPAAYLAAGAALDAVTAVVGGEFARAFCLVRPPGHHAEAAQAMGFCFFNNIAIAAAQARSVLGCARIAILDWDVHHGNGTQHTFEDRPDVLVANTHQWPLYPGTGAADEVGTGAGAGYTINVPLPAGFGDAEYLAVFRELVIPVVESYEPDLVLVSAGFDAHERDPLGSMQVTTEGFAALCALVRDLADRSAGGRLVLVLEGGYDLQGLAESVAACVDVLGGGPAPQANAAPHRAGSIIQTVKGIQRRHWPL